MAFFPCSVTIVLWHGWHVTAADWRSTWIGPLVVDGRGLHLKGRLRMISQDAGLLIVLYYTQLVSLKIGCLVALLRCGFHVNLCLWVMSVTVPGHGTSLEALRYLLRQCYHRPRVYLHNITSVVFFMVPVTILSFLLVQPCG